jgi:hypothetical protein
LQNRLIQTSQTGGQQYSDTSPFSIPCSDLSFNFCTSGFYFVCCTLSAIIRGNQLQFLPAGGSMVLR